MLSYINQEAKKNNWTPCEEQLMHYIYSGINYYKTYPSKACENKDDIKKNIIETVQQIFINTKMNELNMEICLELIEGPMVSQVLDYAIKDNNLGFIHKKITPKSDRKFFCCV
jgi:hypothetical protein